MGYPASYRYIKSHQWVLLEGETATIGITDYAQETLGDIKFVELPTVGQAVEVDAMFGSIESVKSVSEVFSPVSGEVAAINDELTTKPELLNQSANDTWLIKVAMKGTTTGQTLSAAEYEQFVSDESAS